MAKIDLYFPKLLKWEGGFVNDIADKGGATNMGVTIATWKQVGYDKDSDGDIDVEDMRLLNHNDAMMVCKKFYWDRWKADEIKNQSIAELLVEWVWGSGKYGITIPQSVLGVVTDGLVGHQTIESVNNLNQEKLYLDLYNEKIKFISRIVDRSVTEYVEKNPNATRKDLLKYTNLRFKQGWLNRINDFKYMP